MLLIVDILELVGLFLCLCIVPVLSEVIDIMMYLWFSYPYSFTISVATFLSPFQLYLQIFSAVVNSVAHGFSV